VAAHRIALQRLTLRSNTELLNLVADSAREFELTGESRMLDDGIVGPRISLLTESMLALRNRFVAAQATAIADATARLAARATARLAAEARLDASASAEMIAQAANDVVPLRRVG
jgi:hypothetical protein